MSFDWGQFQEVARELIERPDLNTDYEARWRTAIGRSYYAAFGKAYEYLIATGMLLRVKNRDVHEDVRREIANVAPPRGEEIRRELNRLRALRNIADYTSNPTNDDLAEANVDEFNKWSAFDCLGFAANALKILDTLP